MGPPPPFVPCVAWRGETDFVGFSLCATVWEVLSNAADRLAALNPEAVETERSDASPQTPSKKKTPPRVPVATMPVFGTHPIQEWRGHEADVLDLSWSKVRFRIVSLF